MTSDRPQELRKFVAPEFIFGEGSLDRAGQYAANLGARKVLVVSDPGVVEAGWTNRVLASLDGAGLSHAEFTQVTPNPRATEVMAGAETWRKEGCDALVAVGGGSPIDCAKGIGVVVSNNRHVLEFAGVDRISSPMPPLICVPTTGGTSADVSQFAIITDAEQRRKAAIISKAVVPDVSLIDPRTLTSMDSWLTACTGVDAMVHAIEAFVSSGQSPITDTHALEAIRRLSGHLLPSYSDPENVEKRAEVMLGALQAGLAFSNASLGGVHAMAHSLGGMLDLPHGECNAMLVDHVIAFNFPEATDRYTRIGEAMGLDLRKMNQQQARDAVLQGIRRLRSAVGIEETLGNKGVHRTEIPELSRNAMEDPCIVTNPRVPTQRDIEVIYEESL